MVNVMVNDDEFDREFHEAMQQDGVRRLKKKRSRSATDSGDEPALKKTTETLSAEDVALFEAAIDSLDQIPASDEAEEPAEPSQPAPITVPAVEAVAPEDMELFESWLESEAPGGKPKDDPGGASATANRRNLVRRALIEPEAVLDLHRRRLDDALVALEHFINAAHQKRLSVVQVIVGRGLHSHEGPVLGPAVTQRLKHLERVGEIYEAPRSQGGTGALFVFLKR